MVCVSKINLNVKIIEFIYIHMLLIQYIMRIKYSKALDIVMCVFQDCKNFSFWGDVFNCDIFWGIYIYIYSFKIFTQNGGSGSYLLVWIHVG